jgi:hypothetical protein
MAKEVANLLVKEVDNVQSQQPNQSANMTNLTVLMLAALNIAHENMELKGNHLKVIEDISRRSAGLIRRLDEIVQ